MQLNRFTQILASYGSQSAHWPLAERDAAIAFVQQHPSALRLLKQHERLDRLLADDKLEPLYDLQARILNQVPASIEEAAIKKASIKKVSLETTALETAMNVSVARGDGLHSRFLSGFLSWLLPARNTPAMLWRPGLLATIPLVVGIMIGSHLNISGLDDFDTWDDDDYLLALTLDILETNP